MFVEWKRPKWARWPRDLIWWAFGMPLVAVWMFSTPIVFLVLFWTARGRLLWLLGGVMMAERFGLDAASLRKELLQLLTADRRYSAA